jgi:hypothetical protein
MSTQATTWSTVLPVEGLLSISKAMMLTPGSTAVTTAITQRT